MLPPKQRRSRTSFWERKIKAIFNFKLKVSQTHDTLWHPVSNIVSRENRLQEPKGCTVQVPYSSTAVSRQVCTCLSIQFKYSHHYLFHPSCLPQFVWRQQLRVLACGCRLCWVQPCGDTALALRSSQSTRRGESLLYSSLEKQVMLQTGVKDLKWYFWTH